MTVLQTDGLSSSEASSVVEIGCLMMASGLAGAVGQGQTEDGAVFVAIMHPDSGEPMFRIGKERGRYVLRGRRGDRLADGSTLGALSAGRAAGKPTLRLVGSMH
tara:strand:+ start:172 stop:483 length:312 start_codon:yes stop_codon:yes gene_type:complete